MTFSITRSTLASAVSFTRAVTRMRTRMLDALVESRVKRRLELAASDAETSARAAFSRIQALDDMRDRAWGGGRFPRERRAFNREEVLRDAVEAWRENPLARRIVALTTQYVVGGGIVISSDHPPTHEFLQAWWNHRLNRMPTRVYEWCDELTRSGEIFPVISTDAAGMSYIRAFPASEIAEIRTQANDLEQETRFIRKPLALEMQGKEALNQAEAWDAYDEQSDACFPEGNEREGTAHGSAESPQSAGTFPEVMLHYAVNRPVGALRGESDLAPLLRWLTRYAAWLEDRVRLNRFRQSFVYVVYGRFKSAAERLSRQAELNANPPNPGSILVAEDTQERWEVLHPKLDSFEAGEDGLAVKKMIAVGAATPLHFLAEPESATRTTAEAAGGPTFRHYEQRQIYFKWILADLARIAVRRRAQVDPRVDANAPIEIQTADISERDNNALAAAASAIISGFLPLRDRNLIDDAELLRLAYRFAGEVVEVKSKLKVKN